MLPPRANFTINQITMLVSLFQLTSFHRLQRYDNNSNDNNTNNTSNDDNNDDNNDNDNNIVTAEFEFLYVHASTTFQRPPSENVLMMLTA